MSTHYDICMLAFEKEYIRDRGRKSLKQVHPMIDAEEGLHIPRDE